jgi:ferric iron reductase protein FhuF
MMPSAQFLDPDTLLTTLTELALHRGTTNLRAVASQWYKHYNSVLLVPILTALTTARVGLDGGMENVTMLLDDTGLPTSAILTNTVPLPDSPDLHHRVLTGALTNHLIPLIDQLRTVTGVPRRILWANVANVIADLYDKLGKDAEAASAAAEDRHILLDCPVDLLTGGPNPLYNLVRYEPIAVPGLPPALRSRQVCCQRFLLPNDKPCAGCPRRPLDERITAALQKKAKREALR